MQYTLLEFTEVRLEQRDGHKLRGYFAQLFGKESDLFHNHASDGRSIYRYPLIQYKVVRGVPMVVGLGEGASQIVERFWQIKEIDINGHRFALHQKHLQTEELDVGLGNDLQSYEFVSPWMPLNQENVRKYHSYGEKERVEQLKSILIRNILNVFSAVGHRAEQQIMVHLDLGPAKVSKFKNQHMLNFQGSFVSNAILPSYIGLGKSVSRGFGSICKSNG
ncbi:MAG: CRISPR-associated endonuclease Cas6 [Bacteroidota bacterium]